MPAPQSGASDTWLCRCWPAGRMRALKVSTALPVFIAGPRCGLASHGWADPLRSLELKPPRSVEAMTTSPHRV